MAINWGNVLSSAIGAAIQGAGQVGSAYMQSEDAKRMARSQALAEKRRMEQEEAMLERQRKDAAKIRSVAPSGGGGAFAFDPGPAQMLQVANDPMGVIAGQIIDSNPRQNPFLT